MNDRESTGLMGLALFLVSLGVLFAAALVGFLVIRSRTPDWVPPGADGLPGGMWVSTLLLLACSIAAQRAVRDVRRDDIARMQAGLWVTLGVALCFVVSQSWAWLVFNRSVELRSHGLYAFTFYMLTGLHGLHVFGGLGALGWVLFRTRRGDYTRAHHPGVRYLAIYWHFLGAVWLVLFVTLLLSS